MYSMIFARTAGGSRGDFSVRVSRVAESPDFLWFPLRILQVVLRDNPSTSACLSSVSNPAATRASQMFLILQRCSGGITLTPLIHRACRPALLAQQEHGEHT